MLTIYKQYCYLIIVHIDKERKGKYERSKRRSNQMVSEWENEVPLSGSPKQIAWANNLRRTALKQLAEDSLQPLRFRFSWTAMKYSVIALAKKAEQGGFNKFLFDNFMEMYPAFAAHDSDNAPSKKEILAEKKQLFDAVSEKIRGFKSASTWIDADRRTYGLPIDLAILSVLSRGTKIPKEVLREWELDIFSEQ